MKRMTAEAWGRARRWVMAHGRPLEQAQLAHEFDGGDRAAVLEALAAFRNDDGGFGRALEPDVRLPDSSVIATTMATGHLRALGAEADQPLVRSAIGYLLTQLDRHTWAWQNVPDHVDDAPHAPWWNKPDKPTGFTANPGAGIVGDFHHWSSLVPADILAGLTDAAMAFIRRQAAGLSMHDALCFHALRDTEAVPAALRREIAELTRDVGLGLVERDPAQWHTYCTRPLHVVSSPDSMYYDELRDAVETELDYIIDQQLPDGSWQPNWSWGHDSEAWRRSRQDWQGVVILGNLRALRAFDRLPDGV